MLIERITTPEELEKLHQFRYRVFVDELNWMTKQGGKLVDEYDQYAINYAAYDDDRNIIGSIRTVIDNKIGLPLEKLFSLKKFRENKLLTEICKLAVDSKHRSSRITIMLMAAAYQAAYKLGRTHVVLDSFLEEERIYRGLGFTRLSEPYVDPSSNRDSMVVAMITPISTAQNEMMEDRPLLARILTKEDKNINHERLGETAIAV